ncbi:MAG: Asp-tRNA(Asn)/Glu-tRNA(Gln) amidotransferase subunit GatA [candidate division WOR-3 bacterium]
MRTLSELTIRELQEEVRKGNLAYQEILEFTIARIEAEREVNGYISLFLEEARAEAKLADEKRKEIIHPLFGLPIAIKDNIAVKGKPLTCGSKILSPFLSPYDATVVERLKATGCIILGKTNLDEFAMGSSNETSYFGPVRNPLAKERVAGGSSGGSAAVVKYGGAVASLGSDTGGSVRQPAAFCGLYGLKPTYGRVSRFGLVAYASSLDTIGPIGKSTEDCALLLQTIAGYDPKDATSVNLPVEQYLPLTGNLKEIRIGIAEEFLPDDLDPRMKAVIEEAIRELGKEAKDVKRVKLPHLPYGVAAYYLIATAEASSNLARYDGIRYGFRIPAEEISLLYERTRGEGFGEEVKRRIMLGTFALSKGYYEEYYGVGVKVRGLIREDFSSAFDEVDVILGPTYPKPAFQLGEIQEPLEMYLSDIFTTPVNLAGLPAISVPAPRKIDNLPVGLQIIGRPFAERIVLEVAYASERLLDDEKGRGG